MPDSSRHTIAPPLDFPAPDSGRSPQKPGSQADGPPIHIDGFREERTPAQGTAGLGTERVSTQPPTDNTWQAEKTVLLLPAEGREASLWLEDMADGQWHEVTQFPAQLGRGEGSALPLEGENISRVHARLHKLNGGYAIEDAGSLNGLHVNGYRLARVLLAEGDVIDLGGARLQAHLRGPTEKANKTANIPAGARRRRWLPAALIGLSLAVGGVYAWRAWVERRVSITPAPNEASAPVDQAADQTAYLAAATGPVPTTNQKASEPQLQREDEKAVEETSPAAQALTDAEDTATDTPSPAVTKEPAPAAVDATPEPADSALVSETLAESATQFGLEPTPPESKPSTPRYSAKRSQTKIDTAQGKYLTGYVTKALKDLAAISRSSRHGADQRDKAKRLRSELKRLYADYKTGRNAFAAGDKAGAFAAWKQFLRGERALYLPRPSVFAKKVTRVVVAEYRSRGDQAQAADKPHEAYRNWAQAARFDPESPAAQSLAALQSKARERYRAGYRQETVNLKKAQAHWREVLELVPPGSEYHIKARAKLRWYAHLSAQRN